MKKIKYRVEKGRVWKEVFDTDLKVSLACKCVYVGKNNQDCKSWLLERGL